MSRRTEQGDGNSSPGLLRSATPSERKKASVRFAARPEFAENELLAHQDTAASLLNTRAGNDDAMPDPLTPSAKTPRPSNPFATKPIDAAQKNSRKKSKTYRFSETTGLTATQTRESTGKIESVGVAQEDWQEKEEVRKIVNQAIKDGKLPLRDRVKLHLPSGPRPQFGTWWWFKYKMSLAGRGITESLEAFWKDPWVAGHTTAVASKAGTAAASFFELLGLLVKLNVLFALLWSFLLVFPLGLSGENSSTIGVGANVSMSMGVNGSMNASDPGPFTAGALFTGTGPLADSLLFYGYYPAASVFGSTYHIPTAYFSMIIATFTVTIFLLVFHLARLYLQDIKKVSSNAETRIGTEILSAWDHTITSAGGAVRQMLRCTILCRELIDEYRRNVFGYSRGKIFGRFTPPKSPFLSGLITVFVGILYVGGVSAAAFFFQRLQGIEVGEEIGGVLAGENVRALVLPVIVSVVVSFVPIVYIPFRTLNLFHSSVTAKLWDFFVVLCATVGFVGTYLGTFATSIDLSVNPCWETFIGQEIYRLVLVDFFYRTGLTVLYLLAVGIFNLLQRELRIELNVVNMLVGLTYSQVLLWVGFSFMPLLPAIGLVLTVVRYYFHFATIMYTAAVPRTSIRIGRRQYVLAVLFVYVASTVSSFLLLFTREPGTCGPFQGANRIFDFIEDQVDAQSSNWIGEGWNYFFLRGAAVPVVIAFILGLLYLRFRIYAKNILVDELQYSLEREQDDFRALLIARKMITAQPHRKPGRKQSKAGEGDKRRRKSRPKNLSKQGSRASINDR